MLFLRLRMQQLKNTLVEGYKEVPHLYFTLGLFGAANLAFFWRYSIVTDPNYQASTFRHKERYTIVRPDDPRLNNYPRRMITERELVEKFDAAKK